MSVKRGFSSFARERSLPYSRRSGRAGREYVVARRRGAMRDVPTSIVSTVTRNVRTGGFMGLEKKFLDSHRASTLVVDTAAGAECDPAANASCLNAIAQGDGESNRDGRKCTLVSVQIHGQVKMIPAADLADPRSAQHVVVLLVLDKQTNGAQLSSENVVSAANEPNLFFQNLQYVQRFQILARRDIDIEDGNFMADGANTGSTGGAIRFFNIYKRLKIPVVFTGTTADIANISDNSLHVIAVATSSGQVYMEYQARVRFLG